MADKYRTIVADPPWPYKDGPWGEARKGGAGTPFLPYGTMEVEEIAALPVKDLCARGGSHLYLWTTQRFVRDAFWIAEAWGFNPVCLLVWCKPTVAGLPGTWKSTVEFVVFGRKGGLAATGHIPTQWHQWPRTRHSAKPEAFLDLVESVSPGPYLEMFARRQRLGWETWGDQALEHVELAAARPEACPIWGEAKGTSECDVCGGDIINCPVYGPGERRRLEEAAA